MQGKLLPALVALILGSLAPNLPAQTDANRLIYNFCVQHQGQQVGDGICQTLVDSAMRYAGLPTNRYGQEVWRITSDSRGVVISGYYNNVRQGDIVYFHDIFPERYRYQGETGAGGMAVLPEHPRQNHIGVVDRITLDGVRYYDQNAGHQQMVKLDYFSFRDDIKVVDYVVIFRP